MRFFSKFTVLCNACFLLSVILRYAEMHNQFEGRKEQILPLPWLQGTLVILGYGAIIVNVLFLILFLIFSSLKVEMQIPKWIIILNIVVFCCQVYFHFFFK